MSTIVWEEIIGDNWVAERDEQSVGVVCNVGNLFSAFANFDTKRLGYYDTAREARDAVEAAIAERSEVAHE